MYGIGYPLSFFVEIRKLPDPEVTGTPEIADNLFAGTDTINL